MLDASKVGFTVRPIDGDPDGREVWGEIIFRAAHVVPGAEARHSRVELIEVAKARTVALFWRTLYGDLEHAFRKLAQVAMFAASGPSGFSANDVREAVGEIDRLLKVPAPPPGEPALERPVNERIKAAVALMSDAERLDLFGDYCRSCGRNDPMCQCANDE